MHVARDLSDTPSEASLTIKEFVRLPGTEGPATRVNAAGPEGIGTVSEMRFYVNHALSLNTRRTGGARHRRKGDRIEREIVSRHAAIGIKAERYPLSGASRFRGSGHGAGFVTPEKWLGEYDCLFLRRDSAAAMVLLASAALLARVHR